MIEGFISAVFSAYGMTGILLIATVYLSTKLLFLGKEQTRLGAEMDELKEEVTIQVDRIRADYKERSEDVDEQISDISKDIKGLVNWAISTDQGDTGWLQ